MTVNLTGGVDYNTWLAMQKSNNVQSQYQNPYVTNTQMEYPSDSYSFSSNSEGCTDGKDDGKIGFFSAIGNAIKGVGKTIVNGVKGMFTDKEGNFSLGKTLLSVATVAACIAFPAVGVAACVVGGTMGAVQVGKGIYNAATAETDAEAKQAWQDIGGGTFQVAASVVGAKAGVKAVKATSSAGGAKGVSALSQLDDAATIGQKASALGKDMISSTRNNYGNIKSTAVNWAQSETGSKVINAAKHPVKTAKSFAQSETGAKVIDAAKHPVKTAKNFAQSETGAKVIDAAKHPVKTAKSFAQSETGAKVIDAAKHPVKTSKQAWSTVKSKINSESFKAMGTKLTGTAKKIYTDLKTGNTPYEELVNKYGYESVLETLQTLAGTELASESV